MQCIKYHSLRFCQTSLALLFVSSHLSFGVLSLRALGYIRSTDSSIHTFILAEVSGAKGVGTLLPRFDTSDSCFHFDSVFLDSLDANLQ